MLREMAQGKTNAGIEQTLHLSASTVEKHVNSIFGKLQLVDEPVHRRVVAVLRFLGGVALDSDLKEELAPVMAEPPGTAAGSPTVLPDRDLLGPHDVTGLRRGETALATVAARRPRRPRTTRSATGPGSSN